MLRVEKAARSSHSGLSLIETLVVVLVLAILAALLIPAVQLSRSMAKRVGCANNLRQLGIALNNYASSMQTFPPARGSDGASFLVAVLPYIDEYQFYQALTPDGTPSSTAKTITLSSWTVTVSTIALT